ncbi:putative galacturonosyltransferase 15 [Forsythia ovata]|uniref:Galacturonosyltransferase 15 n=1 Tax=Forsythia ovata TaxID=205694 RepID=A0ABD1RK81_9LAMI
MERMVQMAKRRESIYWHLASHGVPKCIHCLSLKLAEEYAVNAVARSCLIPLEFVSCLTDPSFHHVVLLTDNVLAASVVISSTINTFLNPEKLILLLILANCESEGVVLQQQDGLHDYIFENGNCVLLDSNQVGIYLSC